MAATNSVLANDTAITLDWADVTGANKYHAQVSETPDFSGTLMVDDNTLGSSTKAFTDSGTNNAKRWWRWRSSADGGSTWGAWSEVGSYWLNTGASGDVTLSTGKWAIFDPDAVTDIYTFDLFPVHGIVPKKYERSHDRNRAGTLLTEYIVMKDELRLDFDQQHYITHAQMREFRRFNSEIKTFFIAAYQSNGVDNVMNIWKAVFSADPDFSMIANGRLDLFSGSLSIEEV